VGWGQGEGGVCPPIALFHTFPQTAYMDPDEKQTNDRKQPSRRSWWPWARNPTPDPSIAQVMAQWAEYELIFNDILTRLNAQLARQAKMEKKRIERSAQELGQSALAQPAPVPGHPPNSKAALRAQYATGRYGSRIEELLKAKAGNHVGNDQAGEAGSP